MTMTPIGGIEKLIPILPPKGSYYPYRLKAIEEAILKQPEAHFLPFIQSVVKAQEAAYQILQKDHPLSPIVINNSGNVQTPFLSVDQSIEPLYQQALLTMIETLLVDPDINNEIKTHLVTLQTEICQENKTLVAEYYQKLITLELNDLPQHQRLFLVTALQVLLHFEASRIQIDEDYLLRKKELCPCCNMPAISSVLDNSDNGLRYLYCSFCETKWHVVRGQCTECHSNKSLYQSKIEELDRPLYAEVCDECHTYLKTVDRTKTLIADPFIEDILTLPLSLRLSDDEYQTFGLNPYLI